MAKKRQTGTKKHIKKALAQLLTEKKFEDITISDLTRTAGINRGTFYLHYLDKHDMMRQLQEGMETELFNILQQEDLIKYPDLAIQATLDYLVKDLDFIAAIAKTSHITFSKSIKDFVFQLIASSPDWKDKIRDHYDVPQEYALEVYLASAESLITYWINQGAKKSTAEMAEIVLKVLFLNRTQPEKETKQDH
ncbi:TetR/AcrR family transcriptional regulator [Streptococcus dentapri]|uniref:TetR/AcrR family transcriptional regulator n=1 Tax=Streptococcus dentapri TaxID=573564 RepID=A0ABV8D1Y6_9STRE